MPERSPVPESEWQKFSAQNEAGVEAERGKIRRATEGKNQRHQTAAKEFEAEMQRLEKTITPEMRRNEELLNRVESGELTYEQLDEMVLKGYQETPASERNWKRDAGFYRLPENEAGQELQMEAIRDIRALSDTLRALEQHGMSDSQLRHTLDRIEQQLRNS